MIIFHFKDTPRVHICVFVHAPAHVFDFIHAVGGLITLLVVTSLVELGPNSITFPECDLLLWN